MVPLHSNSYGLLVKLVIFDEKLISRSRCNARVFLLVYTKHVYLKYLRKQITIHLSYIITQVVGLHVRPSICKYLMCRSSHFCNVPRKLHWDRFPQTYLYIFNHNLVEKLRFRDVLLITQTLPYLRNIRNKSLQIYHILLLYVWDFKFV
jgi:hypothetical protein